MEAGRGAGAMAESRQDVIGLGQTGGEDAVRGWVFEARDHMPAEPEQPGRMELTSTALCVSQT